MIRFALLFLCLFAGAAQAAIPPDLTYVDQTSPQYARFKDWVDQAIAGNPGYAFSATDAATMYKLTGTAAYAQRAVAEVEAQVAEAEAEIAAGRRAPISYDSYLEVGQMLRDLALTYDWCAPFVTQSQKTRWANYAEQAVWNVWNPNQAHWGAVSAPWSGWSIDDPGNNYFYSFLEGTMYWAFASNSATWKSFLQNQKWPQLTSYFGAFPGGGSREGTGYGLSHQRLFELYRVWRDGMGVDYGASNAHRDDSIDWWIHATMPTLDRVAPIGDQSRVSYPDLFDYHRNVVLQARASSADATRRAHASWWLNAISVPEMGQGFMYRHDLLSPTDAGAPPTALHYTGSGTGVLFARTSWSTDAMWLGFVAGVFDQSHAHREQGSFTLFARDFLAVTENIFTHSGIQEGSDTNNVLRFEKAGQVIEQQRDTTSTMTVTPGSGSDLDVTANLTPAYGGAPEIGSWQRALHFAQRKLTVHDTFAVGSGVTATFQVNTPVQPVVNGKSARAGNLAIRVLSPADAQLTVLDWRTLDNTEFLDGWRLDVRGSGNEFVVELSEADSLFSDGFE